MPGHSKPAEFNGTHVCFSKNFALMVTGAVFIVGLTIGVLSDMVHAAVTYQTKTDAKTTHEEMRDEWHKDLAQVMRALEKIDGRQLEIIKKLGGE